jgi:hypothetical protein
LSMVCSTLLYTLYWSGVKRGSSSDQSPETLLC